MELDGLVAIVTGAGRGIGKAVAEKYYQMGATVALWSRSLEQLREVATKMDKSGDRVVFSKVDVTDEENIKEGIQSVTNKFGKIDILVNNAGANYAFIPIEEMKRETFMELININLTSVFLCCKAVVPIMKKQGRGKIINVSSLAGRTGRPNVGVNYAASKGGVIGMTKSLARELGSTGICVNAIAPGPIFTDLMKQFSKEELAAFNANRALSRYGQPEDIGDAAVFLASSQSDWITGITLDVNGGIAMF